MTKKEIETIILNRDNMLLLDSLELKADMAIGEYRVKGTEWFLTGHFPENPIAPGVIICEIMAQTCCILHKTQNVYLVSIDDAKFRKPVIPDDVISTECRIIRRKGNHFFTECKAFVKGELCANARIGFVVS